MKNDPNLLGCIMKLQAGFWYKQGRLGEAKSEALDAINAYKKIGAMEDVEECRAILQDIEEAVNELVSCH